MVHVHLAIAECDGMQTRVAYLHVPFSLPPIPVVPSRLDKETDCPILLVQMTGRALRYRPGKVARLYCASEALQEQLRAALHRCNAPHLRLV